MTGPGHILIVDDDTAFLRVYREIFENEGLRVTTAQSAVDATAALEAHGPKLDVVLLDQKLQGPGGPDSGIDLVEQIARLAPFAKAVVVTGVCHPQRDRAGVRAGHLRLPREERRVRDVAARQGQKCDRGHERSAHGRAAGVRRGRRAACDMGAGSH